MRDVGRDHFEYDGITEGARGVQRATSASAPRSTAISCEGEYAAATPALLALLPDKSWDVRRRAIEALGAPCTRIDMRVESIRLLGL